MSLATINTGLVPDDGTGDPLRNAFIKVNDNFNDLETRKAEVFYSLPIHPYHVNDIYLTSGQVHVCIIDSTGTYQASDWATPVSINDIITAHSDTTGLDADDHTQYFNEVRGDARYSLVGHDHDTIYSSLSHTHAGVYSPILHTHSIYAPLSHTHTISEITDYTGGGTDVSGWFEIVNSGLSTEYLRCKKPLAGDYDIQAFSNSGAFPGTIWNSMPLATSSSIGGIQLDGTVGNCLRGDGTWGSVGSTIVYPGAGLVLSTGTGWGTPLTNNSVTWNAAQPGHVSLTSFAALTYVSPSHVKMSAAGTFALDLTVVLDADFSSTGLMKRGATLGAYSIVTDNSSTWNSAQPGHTNLISLASLVYVSASFVKLTATNTFTLDTNIYLTTSAASNTYAPIASPTFTGTVTTGGQVIINPATAASSYLQLKYGGVAIGILGSDAAVLSGTATDVNLAVTGLNAFIVSTNSLKRFTVYDDGNVGIGVTIPLQKLHVAGNIIATGEITAYYA